MFLPARSSLASRKPACSIESSQLTAFLTQSCPACRKLTKSENTSNISSQPGSTATIPSYPAVGSTCQALPFPLHYLLPFSTHFSAPLLSTFSSMILLSFSLSHGHSLYLQWYYMYRKFY
ncbi:hypothetical protein BDD12DRAFT_866683 [Trichophaea hybrida]|nr:hypothetical protein BDD12DRAFT_866683 [Trichophaea hybrida]